MADKKETIDTIQIGDKVYDKESVTPSEYFEYVKGMKKSINKDDYQIIIDTSLQMLKKTKLTGQTAMANQIVHETELALRELDAAEKGFDIIVDKKDIELYIDSIEERVVKIIELERYEREIPDEVIDKLELAQTIFDKLYIVFTDYTKEASKKVAKERRDKDPILFGAFVEEDVDGTYVEDRFFFIADWIEEKCDLTLKEIVRYTKENMDKDIAYKISAPKTTEEVKQLLQSYNQKNTVKESHLEPETEKFIDKVKGLVKKKTTRKTSTKSTTRKKKE